MSNIVQKPELSFALQKGKLITKQTPFQQRVSDTASQNDPLKMPNRICLMLDCSGSMKGSKIELLKNAVQNFASRCDFSDTAVALETFPKRDSLPLSTQQVLITSFAILLEAGGGTPMRACVSHVIENTPLTRGVIVSDGQATDWYTNDESLLDEAKSSSPDNVLTLYKEQKIPIDCVHIGDSSSGEELLRRIAAETGGIYIKFTDVSAFSNAFGYLAPAFRGMLTSGQIDAEKLGAKEIQ